jgi:hypothetical protein
MSFADLLQIANSLSAQAMMRSGLLLFLVVLGAPAQAEQFSIKCIWDPGYIMTFDEERKRVISETPGARANKGIIDSATEDDILFHILYGSSSPGLIWNRKTGSLVPVETATDRRFEQYCFKSELRPIMSLYDGIWPF